MWQFLKGCVIIRINGRHPARMLNFLHAAGIPVWNAVSSQPGEMTLTVRARDFTRMRPIVRKSGCRVHIVDRGGLPFVWRRFLRRPVMLIGLLLSLLAIAFSSTRIMRITVEGCDRVPEALVLRALAEQGIRRFGAYPEGTLSDLAALARLYDERIAWLSLTLVGSHLTVTVTEMQKRVPLIDPDTPCDIVAVKDGVLTEMQALAGYTKLAPGDIVHAGDVLIQGEFFPETNEVVEAPLTVHARGNIRANVYYYGEYAAPLTETVYMDTGRTARCRSVAVCDRTLLITPAPYEHYALRDTLSRPLADVMLPVTVTDATFYEQALTERKLSEAEQTERALVEAERLAYLKIPKDAAIVDKDQRVVTVDGVRIAAVGVMTEESIGLEREIPH